MKKLKNNLIKLLNIMKYLTTFENYNVQDMMSIPTSVTKDTETDYIKSLKPYYDFMRTLTGVKNLTDITHEQLDHYVGFSFVAYYMKVMILSDKKVVHILINNELLPLDEPKEILKILESEA